MPQPANALNISQQGVQYFDGVATFTGAQGTSGQILQANTGLAPTYSTATYPSTTTAKQLLFSSANNTISGLNTANNAMLVTNSTGVPSLATLGSGQIFVGSAANTPSAVTLTAGSGIAITSADASITIAVADQGFTWNNVTGVSAAMVKENGFQANNAGQVSLSLPSTASSTFGDRITVMGLGAGGWKITQAAGQQIQFGSSATTLGVGGSLSSNNQFSSLEIVYTTTGGLWSVQSSVGNITVT